MNSAATLAILRFSMQVPPTEAGILEARDALLADLRVLELREPQRFAIELCTHEALVNALVHGVRNGGGGHIGLVCEADGARVRVSVTDDGPGFSRAHAGPSRLPPKGSACPGSRGLFLIHSLMSHTWFNASGNGIVMELTLAADSSPARRLPILEWAGAAPPGREFPAMNRRHACLLNSPQSATRHW